MSTFPIRYLGWMARDIATGPVLWMLALAGFAILVNIDMNGALLFGPERSMTLFVLLATAGIVSRDFAGGYHRTMFAKPISPPLYYLQRWLLGAVIVVAAILATALGVSVRFNIPMHSVDLIVQSGRAYLVIGGLIFLLSTVTRRDWLLASLLLFAQRGLGSVVDSEFWKAQLSPLTYDLASIAYAVLPPFHLINANTPITWSTSLAHAGLYGVGLVLAGLAVLHWRALGPGWRE